MIYSIYVIYMYIFIFIHEQYTLERTIDISQQLFQICINYFVNKVKIDL